MFHYANTDHATIVYQLSMRWGMYVCLKICTFIESGFLGEGKCVGISGLFSLNCHFKQFLIYGIKLPNEFWVVQLAWHS